jgi:hypothetical protein
MSCKEKRQKITGEEIRRELEGYEMVKDVLTLRVHDRVKYIRKKDGRFVRGGIIILGDYKKNYIVIQGFGRDKKTCKAIRYSVNLGEVIIFRLKE